MGTLRDKAAHELLITPGRPHSIVPAAPNAVAYDSEVSEMQRRELLKGLAVLPLSLVAAPARDVAVQPVRGVRPGEPDWPDPAEWAKLRKRVGGRLVKV
jgi:hypothetical protein